QLVHAGINHSFSRRVALFLDHERPSLFIFVLLGIRHHSCLARLALHQRSRDAAFQSPRRAKWQKANRITRRRAPLRWPKSLPSLSATSGLCHRNNLSFGGTSRSRCVPLPNPL